MSAVRRNALANLAGRVAAAALWILITPYALERLGPERFGIWALFFAFTAYITVFDLGIGNTMIRFIAVESAAGDRRGLRRTLSKGLRLSLGLGILWAVVIYVGRSAITTAFHVPSELVQEVHEALLVFAVGSLLLQPVQVLTGSLQGFERLDLSNVCGFVGVAAQTAILYVGLAGGGGLREVAAAAIVGQAVTGVLAAGMLRAELVKVPGLTQGDGSGWRDLMHFGVALQLTNTLGILQLQVGKVLLGVLGTLGMVADFELAFRVASGVAGLPMLIVGAVAPTVTRVWIHEGAAAVGALFTTTLRWVYIYSVIALGLLWIVAPDIVRVWLGPDRERIAVLIRLWVLSYGVHLTWCLGAAFARSVGKPWVEVVSIAVSFVTNIALGLWSVPRYGALGAVAVLAASYVAGCLTFAVTARRAGIPFGPWIRHSLLPRVALGVLAVVMTALVLAAPPVSGVLPPAGWIHGTIAGVAYLVAFSICFMTVGDTQHLTAMLMRSASGALHRRGGALR